MRAVTCRSKPADEFDSSIFSARRSPLRDERELAHRQHVRPTRAPLTEIIGSKNPRLFRRCVDSSWNIRIACNGGHVEVWKSIVAGPPGRAVVPRDLDTATPATNHNPSHRGRVVRDAAERMPRIQP